MTTERTDGRVILSFDTSGPHCAAALRWGPDGLTTRFEAMAKGQAEQLMVRLQDVLTVEGFDWSDLDALAVGVGPGNFTGIRIAVSAVRGLAMGLGIPVIEVSNFELLRGPTSLTDAAPQLVSLPAPRDSAYIQTFVEGAPHGPAQLITIGEKSAPEIHYVRGASILGHGADVIAKLLCTANGHIQPDSKVAEIGHIPETLAAIATAKWRAGRIDSRRPSPLYIKPPDAAPARDTAPKVVA